MLFCRLVLLAVGGIFVASAVYLLAQSPQASLVTVFLACFGLALIGLGLFTTAKTCVTIADGLSQGFWM